MAKKLDLVNATKEKIDAAIELGDNISSIKQYQKAKARLLEDIEKVGTCDASACSSELVDAKTGKNSGLLTKKQFTEKQKLEADLKTLTDAYDLLASNDDFEAFNKSISKFVRSEYDWPYSGEMIRIHKSVEIMTSIIVGAL